MPEQVLVRASVVINGVDLSDHVMSASINYESEIQDLTAMQTGSGPHGRKKLSGLVNWTVDLEFNQDYDAASVDATLFGLVGGAPVSFVAKPTELAVSPTNPSYSGNVLVATYPPISGQVGEPHRSSVTLEGDGILTRATA